jgi:hypothetical protein
VIGAGFVVCLVAIGIKAAVVPDGALPLLTSIL